MAYTEHDGIKCGYCDHWCATIAEKEAHEAATHQSGAPATTPAAPKPARKPRSDKGGKHAPPAPVKSKRVHKAKPNILKEDVGGYFTDKAGAIWELKEYQEAPQVVFTSHNNKLHQERGPLSGFKDFVRLVPRK